MSKLNRSIWLILSIGLQYLLKPHTSSDILTLLNCTILPLLNCTKSTSLGRWKDTKKPYRFCKSPFSFSPFLLFLNRNSFKVFYSEISFIEIIPKCSCYQWSITSKLWKLEGIFFHCCNLGKKKKIAKNNCTKTVLHLIFCSAIIRNLVV